MLKEIERLNGIKIPMLACIYHIRVIQRLKPSQTKVAPFSWIIGG